MSLLPPSLVHFNGRFKFNGLFKKKQELPPPSTPPLTRSTHSDSTDSTLAERQVWWPSDRAHLHRSSWEGLSPQEYAVRVDLERAKRTQEKQLKLAKQRKEEEQLKLEEQGKAFSDMFCASPLRPGKTTFGKPLARQAPITPAEQKTARRKTRLVSGFGV